MSTWRFIYYYLFFGWLFDDVQPTKDETKEDTYCSEEAPISDTHKDTYDTVEDDWNCSRNSCVSDYSSSSDSSYSSSSSSSDF